MTHESRNLAKFRRCLRFFANTWSPIVCEWRIFSFHRTAGVPLLLSSGFANTAQEQWIRGHCSRAVDSRALLKSSGTHDYLARPPGPFPKAFGAHWVAGEDSSPFIARAEARGSLFGSLFKHHWSLSLIASRSVSRRSGGKLSTWVDPVCGCGVRMENDDSGKTRRKTEACEMLDVVRARKCEKAYWPNEPTASAIPTPRMGKGGKKEQGILGPLQRPKPRVQRKTACEMRNEG